MDSQLGPLSFDRAIANLADAQGGVVGHEQLLALGLTDSAIWKRVAAGRLHRLHRGVYAVGHTVLGARGRRFAALLACGDGSLLSHQTAADLWGIRRSSSPRIHVSLTTRSGRARPGIVIHRPRTLSPSETTTHDGLRVTTVARTLLDLADVVDLAALRRAIEWSEKLELFDDAAIHAVIAAHPGRRTRKLLVALGDAEFALTQSELEQAFLRLCAEHGLPRPEVQVPVGGRVVDFLFREQRLVVEADSWKHHRSRYRFDDDRRRDVELLARFGLTTLRFTHRRIAHEAADVAADLGSLLSL